MIELSVIVGSTGVLLLLLAFFSIFLKYWPRIRKPMQSWTSWEQGFHVMRQFLLIICPL